MADGTTENTYALTSLAKVKAAMDKTDLTGVNDTHLIDLINGVSAWCERHCKRSFKSRQYVHTEAGAYDLLAGVGTNKLLLPQRPVTAVTSVKKTPDETALTEGWDQDFSIRKAAGILVLKSGAGYWPTSPTIEITYTAGYLAVADEQFGWQEKCRDLENSVIRAVAFMFERSKLGAASGMTAVSMEAGSVSFDQTPMLDDVKLVWDSMAGRRF